MKVCVGGTFDILHDGHIALLSKAFEIGEKIYIGLSSDAFIKKIGKKAKSYKERKKNLEDFLKKRRWLEKAEILPLEDFYGTAIKEEFDAIVVSYETLQRAKEINKIRKEKGMKELKIILIPFILAEDGIAISTSRIKKGEIKNSKRIKPLRVGIASKNDVKIEATKQIFNDFFKGIKIEYRCIDIKTKKQPIGKEIIEGAIERAKKACIGNDYGVGIEAGINKENDVYFIEQYVAIADKLNYITFGKSPSFQCPSWILEEIEKGKEMKEIIPFKNEEERKKGAVWYFSKKMDRLELTKIGILMALLSRNPRRKVF